MEGLKIALLFLGSFLVGMLTRGVVRDSIGVSSGPDIEIAHFAPDLEAPTTYMLQQGEDIPTLTVHTSTDDQGTIIVELLPKKFVFASSAIATEHDPHAGYVSVTINGELFSYAYDTWFAIPREQLNPGTNVITFGLVTAFHQQVVRPNGSPIIEKIFVTAP